MKTLLMILALMFSSISFASDIPMSIIEAGNANIYNIDLDEGHGSGFYIGDHTFVTGCHVVTPQTNVILSSYKSEYVFTATVESCNPESDIAILKVDDHPSLAKAFSAPPLVLSNVDPKTGQTVYGAGYPMILGLTFVDGHWQDMFSNPAKEGTITMVTAPAVFGDSGSPLMAIIDGEVVVVGVRLGIFSWPVSGVMNRFGPTDMGFVSYMSYAAIVEDVQSELDLLDETP